MSAGLLPHRHFGFGPLINDIVTITDVATASKAKNINDSVEKVFLGVSFRRSTELESTTHKNSNIISQPYHVTGVQP